MSPRVRLQTAMSTLGSVNNKLKPLLYSELSSNSACKHSDNSSRLKLHVLLSSNKQLHASHPQEHNHKCCNKIDLQP